MTAVLAAGLILGLITGIVGRRKGSSFFIWFLVGVILPGIGLATAIFYESRRHDPRRECPKCGAEQPITAQVCLRCGEDLEYPQELLPPKGYHYVDDPT